MDSTQPVTLEYRHPAAGPVPPSRAVGVAMLFAASVLWSLSGVVVKVGKGWRLVEVWNVSP